MKKKSGNNDNNAPKSGNKNVRGERAPIDEAPFTRWIGHTRFIVLLAVLAVLLVAFTLFLQGTLLALRDIWETWGGVANGSSNATDLTITFLELVHIMLEAVVFYLIGIGLYSLFVAPLNLAVGLGVETMGDLEDRIVSLIIVIMAVSFLEHFIRWEDAMETMQAGVALAVVIFTLVYFQRHSHNARQDLREDFTRARSQKDLFSRNSEEHQIQPEETAATPPQLVEEAKNDDNDDDESANHKNNAENRT